MNNTKRKTVFWIRWRIRCPWLTTLEFCLFLEVTTQPTSKNVDYNSYFPKCKLQNYFLSLFIYWGLSFCAFSIKKYLLVAVESKEAASPFAVDLPKLPEWRRFPGEWLRTGDAKNNQIKK